MPRTRSLAWAELKIGVVVIVAIILAGALIFTLGGEGGFFWDRYSLKTVFDNVSGLNEGSPVRVAGLEVGSVKKIELLGDRVEVSFEVSKEMQPRITTGSHAALGSVSLLGESAVDITPSSQGSPIPEWGYVPTGKAAGSIAEVASSATTGIDELTKLLQDIRGGKGTVGKLFTDEALYRDVNDFVSAAEAVTTSINRGRGTLGRLVNDPAAARSLEASLQNLQAVTERIRNGEGSIGQLVTNDALSRSLTSTTTNLDTISGKISRGEGTAGKLVNDTELYNRINSMADRLDKVTAGLQSGEGTAGQLLRDKQLYENMNGAVAELRQLVQDIRADPRKYLNVRVSLF